MKLDFIIIKLRNMHSFTPFYNSSTPFLESSFFSWLSLNSWNPNPFMLNLKHLQQSNQKIQSQTHYSRKLTQINQKTQCQQSKQCKILQDDYRPEKQIQAFEMEQRKSNGRIQCKGRNDYSNILKAFIHLIKTNNILKQKIKFIIQKKGYYLTFEKFLMRIRRKFSKGKTYISPKQILTFLKSCSQCDDQSEKAIGEVFKISLKGFLSLQYVLCLVKSFKGKKQSRKELITKTRQLSRLIFYEGLINENI